MPSDRSVRVPWTTGCAGTHRTRLSGEPGTVGVSLLNTLVGLRVDPVIAGQAVKWLRERAPVVGADQPWFMAVNFVNPHAATDIITGIEQYLISQGASSIQEIVGTVSQ